MAENIVCISLEFAHYWEKLRSLNWLMKINLWSDWCLKGAERKSKGMIAKYLPDSFLSFVRIDATANGIL